MIRGNRGNKIETLKPLKIRYLWRLERGSIPLRAAAIELNSPTQEMLEALILSGLQLFLLSEKGDFHVSGCNAIQTVQPAGVLLLAWMLYVGVFLHGGSGCLLQGQASLSLDTGHRKFKYERKRGILYERMSKL